MKLEELECYLLEDVFDESNLFAALLKCEAKGASRTQTLDLIKSLWRKGLLLVEYPDERPVDVEGLTLEYIDSDDFEYIVLARTQQTLDRLRELGSKSWG